MFTPCVSKTDAGSSDVGGNILIVDDDAGAGRLLALLVRHLGHNAAFVDSGRKALSYLSQHHPDLVILDVMMPEIDGLEVLARIRQDPHIADVPVVMFSALADPKYSQQARNLGARDYWVKAALDFKNLERRLDELLPADQRGN